MTQPAADLMRYTGANEGGPEPAAITQVKGLWGKAKQTLRPVQDQTEQAVDNA